MAGFSRFGRKLLAARIGVLVLAIIVLAASIRVNLFTGWFFHADKFPFGLSIATLLVVGILLLADLVSSNAFTGRALVQCISLGLLSVFWLSFNAFTTSRYAPVPYNCYSAIPPEMADMQTWCVNVQVVKAFMWIEWVFITVLVLTMARFVQSECARGNRHVLKTPLCRYDADNEFGNDLKVDYPFAPGMGNTSDPFDVRHPSEFLQYEKTQEQNSNSAYFQTQRYEAPSSLQSRNISEEPVTPTYYAEAAGLAGVGATRYQQTASNVQQRF
ncbi:hypothetical protein DL96DRAFT_1814349 [Flagelloscypha sp. PMI_526]|nr:hypothetical protein DL96DRAFT_1814349 [Flagelloscypha sp. PMI_526]